MPCFRCDFTTAKCYASSLLKIILIFFCFPFSKEEGNWGQAEFESGDFSMKFSDSIPRKLIRSSEELSQIFSSVLYTNRNKQQQKTIRCQYQIYQQYQIKHCVRIHSKSDISEAVRLLLLSVRRELVRNQAIIRSWWGRAELLSSHKVNELHHTVLWITKGGFHSC